MSANGTNWKERTALVGLGLSVLGTAGCCHLSASREPRTCEALPETLAAEFAAAQADPPPVIEGDPVTGRSYYFQPVEVPAAPDRFATNRVITLDCLLPREAGRHPVVLVLPISGGGYQLERHFARYFARHGLAAVVVHRRKIDIETRSAEDTNELLKGSVHDNMQVIDWIVRRPDFDPERIGVFGTSIGGVKAVMVAALDARVRAAVIGLAGSDLGYILAHTTEPGFTKVRKEMMRERNFTRAELQNEFTAAFTFDPKVVAPYVDRDKVLLVLALFDRAVPFRKGWELREQLGKPETIIVPTGHYTAALYLPYIRSQSLHFLLKKLDAE
ncbi:MAG TPA: prolyl oligopeptidase family serine peptidase [Verrucomicrobiae bacterium]|jgi:acetyl esterase/lipase